MKQSPCRLMAAVWLSIGLPLLAGEYAEDTWTDAESAETESGSSSWFNFDLKPAIDAESSVLWSNGITLQEYSLYGKISADAWDLGVAVGHNRFDIDYEPEIFGFDTTLQETTERISVDGSFQVGNFRFLSSFGYYDGYSDYRSLWIAEYYRQLFGAVGGFRNPNPRGVSLTYGVEWEYIPVVAKVRLIGSYSRDTIAPSWDFGANGLESARPNLYTKSIQLQTENVLTPRLVWQNTGQWTETTNREKRWSYRTSANYAIADGLFLRAQGGFAVERPQFDAIYTGLTLEKQIADNWYARLSGRYYIDTGEIENSLGGFNSSAPSLESYEFGLGLRWQGVHSALNLYAGYYRTNYEPLAADNAFLRNLYIDREWGIVQLNYTYTF